MFQSPLKPQSPRAVAGNGMTARAISPKPVGQVFWTLPQDVSTAPQKPQLCPSSASRASSPPPVCMEQAPIGPCLRASHAPNLAANAAVRKVSSRKVEHSLSWAQSGALSPSRPPVSKAGCQPFPVLGTGGSVGAITAAAIARPATAGSTLGSSAGSVTVGPAAVFMHPALEEPFAAPLDKGQQQQPRHGAKTGPSPDKKTWQPQQLRRGASKPPSCCSNTVFTSAIPRTAATVETAVLAPPQRALVPVVVESQDEAMKQGAQGGFEQELQARHCEDLERGLAELKDELSREFRGATEELRARMDSRHGEILAGLEENRSQYLAKDFILQEFERLSSVIEQCVENKEAEAEERRSREAAEAEERRLHGAELNQLRLELQAVRGREEEVAKVNLQSKREAEASPIDLPGSLATDFEQHRANMEALEASLAVLRDDAGAQFHDLQVDMEALSRLGAQFQTIPVDIAALSEELANVRGNSEEHMEVVREDLQAAHGELQGSMAELRVEVSAAVQAFRQAAGEADREQHAQMSAVVEEVSGRLTFVESRVGRLIAEMQGSRLDKSALEYLDKLGEGQQVNQQGEGYPHSRAPTLLDSPRKMLPSTPSGKPMMRLSPSPDSKKCPVSSPEEFLLSPPACEPRC